MSAAQEFGDIWHSTEATFKASIRSIGTAVTMAGVGMYLHRNGFIVGEGKRTLALISQQVTFPLFLFTKIIYCNQDWSTDPCPDVTKSLADVWMLLFWPIYVVGSGIVVGQLVARVCRTPPHQTRAVLAAVGFGNSTGLCITMLAVVHANFPATSDLGRIDPTLFLSVYLLLYPVLQWGIGGWLLAPEEEEEEEEEKHHDDESSCGGGSESGSPADVFGGPAAAAGLAGAAGHRRSNSAGAVITAVGDNVDEHNHVQHNRNNPIRNRSLGKHVLNNSEMKELYQIHRRGLMSSDEGLYMSEVNLVQLAEEMEQQEQLMKLKKELQLQQQINQNQRFPAVPEDEATQHENNKTNNYGTYDFQMSLSEPAPLSSSAALLLNHNNNNNNNNEQKPLLQYGIRQKSDPILYEDTAWQAIKNISKRCFQPPVVGGLLGIFVATLPQLRGIFVDIIDRQSHAPLQWLFDGLYSVGLTAVPINMMILGCNLSASLQNKHLFRSFNDAFTSVVSKKNDSSLGQSNRSMASTSASSLLPLPTMIGIVVGKMIVLPFVGIVTSLILKNYVWHIPAEIDGAFYLVLMIVFLTPTANNVMVMVELSGSNAKEGIASVIALQYACAPIILSITMTIAIGTASNWS